MVYNKDTLQAMMAKPIHLADSLHLPLYCGEFGVIENSPRDSKLRWYRDMVAVFDKNGIAYANWNYKSGNFGVVDENCHGHNHAKDPYRKINNSPNDDKV